MERAFSSGATGDRARTPKHRAATRPSMEPSSFQCFCGQEFNDRDTLVQHNVDHHEMDELASREAVDEKYPRAA